MKLGLIALFSLLLTVSCARRANDDRATDARDTTTNGNYMDGGSRGSNTNSNTP
jgi:hypothetical protein